MSVESDKLSEKDRFEQPIAEQTPSRGKRIALGRMAGIKKSRQEQQSELAVNKASRDLVPTADVSPRKRFNPYLWSFILFVVLPTLAGVFYYFYIASDQFQSQTRFTVQAMEPDLFEKSTDGEANSTATSNSFSVTSPNQSAYIITSYLRSQAVIEEVGRRIDIRQIFQRPEADPIAALSRDATSDQLTAYWQRMVDAYVDPTSGIVTVSVTAFRPNDSLELNRALLTQSEKLINSISDQAQGDATKTAQTEVKQTFVELQASLQALQDFRNKDALIDPGQSNSQIVNLLMPVMTEQLKLKNDEAVMSAELAADAPSLEALRSRIAALDTQIATLRGQLTGTDSKTVANSLSKFEALDVERLLNERKYARAQSALDRAELRARRQAIYLAVFEPPALPEYPAFPRRFIYSLMVFISLLIFWGIGSAIYASVEDHRL